MATLRWTIGLLLGGWVLAQPITDLNWQNHPQIKAVRAEYTVVQTLKQKQQLKLQSKTYSGCAAMGLERLLYADAQQKVRLYISKGGSDDSAYTFEHTYDASGRLRFVLVQMGAVNGSSAEQRFYFDAKGTLIWHSEQAKGPGYPWMPHLIAHLTHDPKTSFAAPDPCR